MKPAGASLVRLFKGILPNPRAKDLKAMGYSIPHKETSLADLLSPVPMGPLDSQPLVTVLMSTFNRRKFLSEAVDSVLAQSYSRWELVICDDGSVDDSWSILKEYAKADNRIRVLWQPNRGQASGFNTAYAASRGQIICQLDSDDAYFPTKLQKVVLQFASSPDVGMVIHRVLRVAPNGKATGPMPLSAVLPSGWLASSTVQNSGILPNLPPGGGIAVRREIADQILPLEETGPLRNFGDTPFMRLPPLMTHIRPVEECLGIYRKHDDNQSVLTSWSAYVDRELAAYERLWKQQFRYLESRPPGLGGLLAPLEKNQHVLSMRYMQARLSGASEVKQRHAELVSRPQGRQEPFLWRLFWKWAPWIPTALFLRIFTILVSPSRVKQWLSCPLRISRHLANRLWPAATKRISSTRSVGLQA